MPVAWAVSLSGDLTVMKRSTVFLYSLRGQRSLRNTLNVLTALFLLLLFLRKHWLKSVGSPSSRIDRAVFSNERDISKVEIHGFSTRY